MKPSAIEYLSCIVCAAPLGLNISEQIPSPSGESCEVISGSLDCAKCLKSYPIIRGIPRFIDAERSSHVDMETGNRFGMSWKEFPRLDQRYSQQLFDWLSPVTPQFLKNKVVLEAGCGKGRHAKVVSEAGARQVFGIDIGHAVDVAYANVGHLPRVHIIQADIRWLPFSEVFDFAFSVGVLHHMTEPGTGFAQIVKCLKPDGSICTWVYGRENNWWLLYFVDPIRIFVTSKLPRPILRVISTALAVPVSLWAKLVAYPWKKLQEKLTWLPDLFYQEYMAYIARHDFNEIEHIVFDHLVTPVAHYIPAGEVKRWFAEAKLQNPVIRWHNRNSWTGFGSFVPVSTESPQLQDSTARR
jgi:SAM-dependent methyltransferase